MEHSLQATSGFESRQCQMNWLQSHAKFVQPTLKYFAFNLAVGGGGYNFDGVGQNFDFTVCSK